MPTPSEKPIQIEPLTKKEQKQQGVPASDVTENPEYPKEWLDKDVPELVQKGFRYYKRVTQDGRVYMNLRKKRVDRGLGVWTEEKEAKLFHFFPTVGTSSGIVKPPPWTPVPAKTQSFPQGRQFLSVPISRVAIIPRDYVPSINIVRYFQIFKENGYPGDFSGFINETVTNYMVNVHHITLPVMLEEEIEFRREDENVNTATSPQSPTN